MELWINLSHLGYPNYSISDTGKVRKNISGKEILGSVITNGYRQFLLSHSGVVKAEYVHRLVLLAFRGIPKDRSITADHINRNKLDNNLSNLRWATREEQACNSSFSTSSIQHKGVEQRNLDGTLLEVWRSRQEAASSLGIDPRRISEACLGLKVNNMYEGFVWTNPTTEVNNDEIWKPCVDTNFEGFYVSSLGRIRTKAGTITNGAESNGYKMASTYVYGVRTTRKVHCLVAEAFLGKKDLLVNHKDGNKSNNRVDNLEYVTYSQNAQHAHNIGIHPGNKCKEVIQCDLNGNEITRHSSITDAKIALGKGDIKSALSGRCKTAGGYIWKYVDLKIPFERYFFLRLNIWNPANFPILYVSRDYRITIRIKPLTI